MKSNLSIFKNPLAKFESFSTYSDLPGQTDQIKDIIDKHDEIKTITNDYQTKYNELDQNLNYKDFNFTKSDGDIWLDYKDKERNIKDAQKEDTHEMIMQYNHAYLVGMITIATVLITTYITLRK
jgi:hypothetical protein